MKTIYYIENLSNPGQPIEEDTVVDVEILLTTLGLDELTITGLKGDLLEEVYLWVPKTATSGVPNYGWIQEGIEEREWQTGDDDDGESNTGNYVQFPRILDDNTPTLDVKLKLNIINVESMPTNVYLETLEIGDTTANLIFRSGVNPDEPVYIANLSFNKNSYEFSDYPIVYEELTENIGNFWIKNSGTSNGVVQSIEFFDNNNEVKDYVSFYSEQSSYVDHTATIARNKTEKYLIKIDAQSDRTGDKFMDSFSSQNIVGGKEDDFILTGWIKVTYNNGADYKYVGVSFTFKCPILEFDYDTSSFFETSTGKDPLSFNFNFMKQNHSEFGKVLKLYNKGNSPLRIGNISTNFSLDGDNSDLVGSIVPDDSFPITISANSSYEFKFKLTDTPSLHVDVPYLIQQNGQYDSTLKETINTTFEREITISSNAINYNTDIHTTDRNVAYDNNSGKSVEKFSCSVFYDYSDSSQYYWTIMEVDSFTPPVLKPLVDSIAKIDIFNYDNYDSATHPSDHFKLEIVDHSANLGTTAWLNSGYMTEQTPSSQPLFVEVLDFYDELEARQDFDDLATYVTVCLPKEAGENRYHEGEPEVTANPKLEGHIRRKYDFLKDINPFKILVTKVVKNSQTNGIDEVGTIDPKDQTTTYYDTNEKLLIYLYARARELTWDSYSVMNYKNTTMSNFQAGNLANFVHRKEGIIDVDSYGLLNYIIKGGVNQGELTDTVSTKIKQIVKEKSSYGLLNYAYKEDIINLIEVSQEGTLTSFGLLNYYPNTYTIDIKNPKGIKQHEPDLFSKTAYGVLNYKNKQSNFPDVTRSINNVLIRKKHNPDIVKSYGVLNIAPFDHPDENQSLGLMDVKKVVNQTNMYGYGLLNYIPNIDAIDIKNPKGIEQYRPELKTKNSYGLTNYSIKNDIGILKGTAWYGQGANSGQYIGISQFEDPSSITKYANALFNYITNKDTSKIKGSYDLGSGKYGIIQYDPSKITKQSYSLSNYSSYGYSGSMIGNYSGVSSKKIPQDVVSYGVVNFNCYPFLYCLVKQSTPDFNVKTWNQDYTTEDPGHSIDIGTLSLYITEWSKENIFEEAHSAHRWRINYSGWGNMELANLGNEDLIIHGVVIENNSPGRIHDLIIDQQLAIDDDPFPMTIVANDDINSSFQIVGVEDGFITGQDANETDDWYDTNGTMNPPTIKIYTNDPNPDPSDSKHVIIDDSNHTYDGLAEWTIEVTWGTTWAEDPGS